MQKGTKIFAILFCLTVLFGIISFSLEVRVGDNAVIANEGIRPAVTVSIYYPAMCI